MEKLEFREPETFEGTLTQEQIEGLDKQALKTALMLSQLSQAGDFSIGWIRTIVAHSNHQQTEIAELKEAVRRQEAQIARLQSAEKIVRWLLTVSGAAVLVELMRRVMHNSP